MINEIFISRNGQLKTIFLKKRFFLLNSMHRTIHTNLKQNYRYIISNNNYKHYISHAKSDMRAIVDLHTVHADVSSQPTRPWVYIRTGLQYA